MNHFLTKNFSTVAGAGGGGGKSDPPPSPRLNPPKLGALSAISSYSYSESVDALSEGPIGGIVNQNGQFVDGHRIFEGIYIDDVPVKKTINPLDETIPKATVSLAGIMSSVTSNWFSGENFQDYSLSSLSTEDVSYDPSLSVSNPYQAHIVGNEQLSAEIIYGKKNIAKAILKGRNLLSKFANDPNNESAVTEIAKQKLLRYDAFSTESVIENNILKDNPSSTDYPFFCVKINLGNIYSSSEGVQTISDIPVGKSTAFYLENDISEIISEKLEISELGRRRLIRPLGWIDMSFISQVGPNALGGYIYIFGIHENGFPTEETVTSLRDIVTDFHVIDFTEEKYNYSNILAEARKGEELQQPLGFFDRTYLDKQFGIKLLGPFSNQGQILKVKTFVQASTDGVIDYLPENSVDSSAVSSENLISVPDKITLETLWNLQGRLTKDGELYQTTLSNISAWSSKVEKTLTQTGDDFVLKVKFKKADFQYFLATITRTLGVYSYSVRFFNYGIIRYINIAEGYQYGWSSSAVSEVNRVKYLSMAIMLASPVEGSLDTRASKSYSDWSASSISQFDEEPNSVVHVVRNPNVGSVYVTMGIRALSDTAETTKTLTGTSQSVDAGSKIPSAVRFKIEIGLQDSNGVELPATKSIVYQVIGLAETPALIDIGRVENANNVPNYSRFIQGTENIASELTLPEPVEGSFRYVRVARTTHETYSSLIQREISLEKITEIIDAKFSYPNTAIVGIKLDSRTLSSLPPRSYDVRLKRIFVPSNYYPLKADGSDKRLYKTAAEFAAAETSDKLIYDGHWDGTFKEAWSDNPAWILFDLLINRRYGMGNYVSADQINIWELYKIGRFCDSVDDDGYFYGTPSATGGLEPRYACNIIIADKVNVFDAIKNLVSTFRGNIFYSNSFIDFTDDRVKLPTYFFNNQNAKDGIFNYTNSRRDQQYNTLEVSYFDRDDGFKVKTEYIEDPEDIKKRGVLRTEIDTFGVTSRAHANRIGKHIIYSTINENQAVSFICGPEVLSCRPGDLISVEDDLKSLQKNIGRVLDIDYTNKILRLDEQFDTGAFLNEVSLFIPTGQKTYNDYYDLAVSPSKLAMNELYSNDVPQIATFKTSGYQNLDYGCQLFINQTGENALLLDKAKIGGIYSITLSGLKQEIYKLTSIRESSPLEYEVSAIKFDTGKFGQIESGRGLVDFYNNYPNVLSPTQGAATINQDNIYQLSFPVIYALNTGNYDQQADSIDISGAWSGVNGATHYDYELVTPRYNSITGRTADLFATFTDQTQAGRFTLKVSARNISSVPNPIGPTYSSGITVLSYSAPVRTNSVFAGIRVKNS
jgi:hypothetical protein